MSKRDTFFKKKYVSNSEIRTPVAVETNDDTSMPDKPLTPPNVQEFNLKRQIVIQDHVNKYVNSLSTNKMKSDELISKKVHFNLKIQTIHTTMILIVVDFNLHGSNRPPHIKIPGYAPTLNLFFSTQIHAVGKQRFQISKIRASPMHSLFKPLFLQNLESEIIKSLPNNLSTQVLFSFRDLHLKNHCSSNPLFYSSLFSIQIKQFLSFWGFDSIRKE